MFGMGIGEILLVAIIAIIFLGPDKLPKAMVEVAKFFKAVKKTVNDAKDTIDKEVNLTEIKEEAKKYEESLKKTSGDLSKMVEMNNFDNGEYREKLKSYGDIKKESNSNENISDSKDSTKSVSDSEIVAQNSTTTSAKSEDISNSVQNSQKVDEGKKEVKDA